MKKISNWIFLILIVLLLFVPEFKAFVLKGLTYTGLFNATAKEQVVTSDDLNSHPFSMVAHTGKEISSETLTNKVVFINFWASWCAPCVAEFADIEALYQELKNNPEIVFITLNHDKTPAKGLEFMQKKKYSIPVYELKNQVSRNWFKGTLPTTLVLNKKGKVVFQKENLANYNTKDFKNFLITLANQK